MRPGGDEGNSPITAVFGVAIFLLFLLFATQVTVYLYARSVVGAAAYDAARRAAAEGGDCVAAHDHARLLLGAYGTHMQITCTPGTDQTTVRVQGPSPARLLSGVTAIAGLDEIDRTATIRTEQLR